MAIACRHERTLALDAAQYEVRFRVSALGVMHVVGRDRSRSVVLGELRQDGVERSLLGETVILKLDVQRAWLEELTKLAQEVISLVLALVEDPLAKRPAHAARERNEAFRVAFELRKEVACAGALQVGGLDVHARLGARESSGMRR